MSFQLGPWRDVLRAPYAVKIVRPAVAWVDEMAVPAFDYYARRASAGQADITWTPLLSHDLPVLPALMPFLMRPCGWRWPKAPIAIYAPCCQPISIGSIGLKQRSIGLASASSVISD